MRLLLLIGLLAAVDVSAQQLAVGGSPANSATGPSEVSQEDPSPSEPDDAEGAAERQAVTDPCAPPALEGEAWIDRMNRWMYTSVCSSAAWFDGFFGADRTSDESDRTYGSVTAHALWSEYHGFDPRFRGRVHLSLPNLDRRARAFLGRVDEEEYLADVTDAEGGTRALRDDEDAEWLLGLGYTPLDTGSRRLTLSVGAKLDLPPKPYAKSQYRWYRMFGDARLFRWRQTVFWRQDDGFGTTTSLDLERRIDSRRLVRWAGTGTWSETTLGASWWSSLTLFQGLDDRRALLYRLWVSGETEAPETVEEYGARVVFRRRLSRDWLYGELGAGVSWPKEDPLERREASFGVGVGIEVQFGGFGGDPDDR